MIATPTGLSLLLASALFLSGCASGPGPVKPAEPLPPVVQAVPKKPPVLGLVLRVKHGTELLQEGHLPPQEPWLSMPNTGSW